jgi:hypothetical protein
MLKQDEYQVASQGERSLQSASAVSQSLDQQIRETLETLRLKLDNLKLYLSWRK